MTTETIKRIVYKKGDALHLKAGVRYEIVVDVGDDELKAGEWYTLEFNAETEKLKPAEWIENVLYAYGEARYAECSASPSNESAREKLYDAIDTPVDWSDK